MVKFRCPVCTQKILVNDEGIGLVIPCPNCVRDIPIPRETAPEFQGQVLSLAPTPLGVGALRPQLARLLMDRLFQAVYQQRRHLLESQQTGATQIALLEQRLAVIQHEHQTQIRAYDQRIAELEQSLAQRDEQTRQFIRERLQLTQAALDRQEDRETDSVDYVLRG